MGSNSSKSKRNEKKIDSDSNGKDDKDSKNKIKVLMLGIGASGKSTFCRSALMAHNSFTSNRLQNVTYIESIRENCVETIRDLIGHLEASYTDGIGEICNRKEVKQAIEIIRHGSLLSHKYSQISKIRDAIKILWNLEAVQYVFKHRNSTTDHDGLYIVNDNIEHFMRKIDVIMDSKYMEPTFQDSLKMRQRTTGLIQNQFKDEQDTEWRLNEIGCQPQTRSRRYWMHYLQDCNFMIFMHSLNGYCKKLQFSGPRCKTEWDNSLYLLQQVTDIEQWKHVPLIIILNKTDLFKECLVSASMKEHFGDEYKGLNLNVPIDVKIKICKRLIECIENDIGDIGDIDKIVDDVASVIIMYVDLKYSYNLDKVYQDGIEFTKNKLLQIRPNAIFYEVCSIESAEVKQVLVQIKHYIHSKDLENVLP